jgi:two-component system chemotaxis response regulator CheY
MTENENSEWVRVEGGSSWVKPTKKKPKVLLADDEAVVRMTMEKIMTSMKCDIAGEAKNGDEAVKFFREKRPDLLLLDINMPFKTGEEALKEILAEFPDAFVIMLTSLADKKSVENCLTLGAANYIRKDTPIHEIKRIIKETWKIFKN